MGDEAAKQFIILFSASFMNYRNAKSNRSTILSNTPTNLHLICLQDHRLGRENEIQWPHWSRQQFCIMIKNPSLRRSCQNVAIFIFQPPNQGHVQRMSTNSCGHVSIFCTHLNILSINGNSNIGGRARARIRYIIICKDICAHQMKERNSCSKTSGILSPPAVFMKKSLNPITNPPLLCSRGWPLNLLEMVYHHQHSINQAFK